MKNKPIYIFDGYYDAREDCYGPCFGKEEDYMEAVYYSIYRSDHPKQIDKKDGISRNTRRGRIRKIR